MDEDDNYDRRGSASEDGGHPEEGLGQAGTMLARRLAAATRTVSRIDERLRAEENALTEELIKGRLEETLPDKLPDFVGSEHEVWSDGTSVVKATLPGVFGRRWGARGLAFLRSILKEWGSLERCFHLIGESLDLRRKPASLG